MKCVDCKFWKSAEKPAYDPDMGECHRHAPRPLGEAALVILGTIRSRGVSLVTDHLERSDPVPDGGGIYDRQAMWPGTFAEEFCGEFVAAKQADWC